ncbi:MAG: hypothetical protein GWP09_00430 [Nitrospiraceae bacterium]|nr:hypothetical protein [Nitrospiraceae bacterium]
MRSKAILLTLTLFLGSMIPISVGAGTFENNYVQFKNQTEYNIMLIHAEQDWQNDKIATLEGKYISLFQKFIMVYIITAIGLISTIMLVWYRLNKKMFVWYKLCKERDRIESNRD